MNCLASAWGLCCTISCEASWFYSTAQYPFVVKQILRMGGEGWTQTPKSGTSCSGSFLGYRTQRFWTTREHSHSPSGNIHCLRVCLGRCDVELIIRYVEEEKLINRHAGRGRSRRSPSSRPPVPWHRREPRTAPAARSGSANGDLAVGSWSSQLRKQVEQGGMKGFTWTVARGQIFNILLARAVAFRSRTGQQLWLLREGAWKGCSVTCWKRWVRFRSSPGSLVTLPLAIGLSCGDEHPRVVPLRSLWRGLRSDSALRVVALNRSGRWENEHGVCQRASGLGASRPRSFYSQQDVIVLSMILLRLIRMAVESWTLIRGFLIGS